MPDDLERITDFLLETLAMNFIPFPSDLLLRRHSLAQHAFRSAAYGYLLAIERERDPRPAVVTSILHHLRMVRAPQDSQQASFAHERAGADQLLLLPDSTRERLGALYDESNAEFTDARALSQYLELKHYAEQGARLGDPLFDRLKEGTSFPPNFWSKVNESWIVGSSSDDEYIQLLLDIYKASVMQRTGLLLAGVPSQTIGEHSVRAALTRYLLAEMQGQDGFSLMASLLFHDVPEARTGDHNAISKQYSTRQRGDDAVFTQQTTPVKGLADVLRSYDTSLGKEADALELMIETRYLESLGIQVHEELADFRPARGRVYGRKADYGATADTRSDAMVLWPGQNS